MEAQQLLEIRKKRGYEIAQKGNLKFINNKWSVPSERTRNMYTVVLRLNKSTCTCDDFTVRQVKCKHIFAVEIFISKQTDQNGVITITKRMTYSQNWPQYDKSQIEEKSRFMTLLSDLVQEVEEPQYAFGRPKTSIRDLLFASGLKVYTQFSLRRFISDLGTAKEKGFVIHTPCFASVGHFMEREDITPVLKRLITLSALPLKEVETNFAIDSSGFRTTNFTDYCREKHRIAKEHVWLKAHICCGVKTNVVTAIEVTDGFSNDSKQFIPLAKDTYENGFKVGEVSADKAYNSLKNYSAILSIGGTAYIPFKSNATGKSDRSCGSKGRLWRKMYNYFVYNQDDFLEHYHMRSNVESTFNMIKAKFTDLIRSKTPTAQINEVLLKVLCHNISVLIQEMFELGIEPNFLRGE